jgi:hypothetical protein
MFCYAYCTERHELLPMPPISYSGFMPEPLYYCPKCKHVYHLHSGILSALIGKRYSDYVFKTDYEVAQEELDKEFPGVPI